MTLLAFAFWLGLAHADSSPPPKAKPIITREDGQPVVAVWPSGNTAELRLQETGPAAIQAPFQVSENSCRAKAGQTFSMTLFLEQKQLFFVWTKHSDPKRIGEPVTFGGDAHLPIAYDLILTNDVRMGTSGLGKDIPPDKFEIADPTWIPGMEDGVLRNLTIDSWFTERMVSNPQTGIDENRIAVEIDGMQVHATDSSHAEIVRYDSITRGTGGAIFSLIGDVTTWLISSPEGECQISAKPDSGRVDEQVNEYLSHPDEANKVYIWKQDALTKLMDTENFFLFALLEQADE